jgi:protein TonB
MMPHKVGILDLEQHGPGSQTPTPAKQSSQLQPQSSARKVPVHLEEGLVENLHLKKPRTVWDILVSAFGHAAAVALIILIPLCYTHAISLPEYEKTILVAPPPPPPPAPMRAFAPRHIQSFIAQGKLFAPRIIPKTIAQIKETAPPGQAALGSLGGVPGGVPGGQLGGVLGGILGGNRLIPSPPPPPRAPARATLYRVGGKVQPPRLLEQVQPVYPFLARQARIQGDVELDCIIDQHGDVTQMKLVSGSPLFVNAAFNAVRQWKYQPTLLNGQPINVEMVVNVHFQLGD